MTRASGNGRRVPGEGAPGEGAPGEGAPGEGAPGEGASDEEVPDEEVPDEEVPDEEVPDEEVPDERGFDERGSATVIMLGVIAVVLILTVSGLTLASAVLASHRARAAADLAALASAGVLMRGEPPGEACRLAARVASANHGRLQGCTAAGSEVRLSVAVPTGMQGLGVATARSRAGPGLPGPAFRNAG